MTLVNIQTDVDVQGVTIAERIEMLKAYPTYRGHTVRFWPVMHETLGKVGGWQVEHSPECVGCTPEERTAVRQVSGPWGPIGRLDAHPTPATLRLKLAQEG